MDILSRAGRKQPVRRNILLKRLIPGGNHHFSVFIAGQRDNPGRGATLYGRLAVRLNGIHGKGRRENHTRNRERSGIRRLSVKRAGKERRGNQCQNYFHKCGTTSKGREFQNRAFFVPGQFIMIMARFATIGGGRWQANMMTKAQSSYPGTAHYLDRFCSPDSFTFPMLQ